MPTPALFTPFTLEGVTLKNRIAVSPMCQYMAEAGVPNVWHTAHLAGLARGGAGLVVVEATAVSPEGRITPYCTGLWNDSQAAAFAPIVASIKAAGAVAGIQLAHAGRKGSANRPWEGDNHLAPDDARGWQTLAPSALAFGANLPRVPHAMTLADIARVKADFVAAAIRARAVGFEWLVLHFAHGYLAQSFLSPQANHRTDAYGGDVAGRSRFMLETLAAVREVWPAHLPLTVRLGVLAFDGRDAEMLAESVALLQAMKKIGLDFVDVSIDFSTPASKPPWAPGFMIPYAAGIRQASGLPTATSWLIRTAPQANAAIAEGQLDVVMLGRAFLENPHWPYAAAKQLGLENPAALMPPPYAHWISRP